jgi:hypothetical protein
MIADKVEIGDVTFKSPENRMKRNLTIRIKTAREPKRLEHKVKK